MLNNLTFHPILLIVVGALLALFGYKIQKLTLSLVCFLLGYTISNAICPHFITDSTIITIVNIVVGIIIASLGFKIEKLAVSATVAYLVYTSIASFAGIIPFELTETIKAVIALICGIASLLLIRPILIIVTSLGGASILLNGVSTYITIPNEYYLIVLIVVFALCALIQFKTNKRWI